MKIIKGAYFIIRRLLSRPKAGVYVEDKVALNGCSMLAPVSVGFRSYANDSALRNVSIGRFCSIGRRCTIGAPKHDVEATSTHPFVAATSQPRLIIGNDVWIGDGVIILSGLTIGNGAVIGAGSVVTKDVPPYAIVGGVPAKLLKMRFNERDRSLLEASRWWDKGDLIQEASSFDHMFQLCSSAPDVIYVTRKYRLSNPSLPFLP